MGRKKEDYLHAAGRIASLENQLIARETLMKAIDADSAEEAYHVLFGRKSHGYHSAEHYEKELEENLAKNFKLAENITDGIGLTAFFRYPIDGHNLKVMVKAKAAAGNFSSLYKTGGTISADMLEHELNQGRFETVPGILGQAGLDAADQLAKTGEPQGAAFIIDKAVLALMRKRADELDCRLLIRYITAKIDQINASSALRLMAMKKDLHMAAMAFAEGGTLSVRDLKAAYARGYKAVRDLTGKVQAEYQADRSFNTLFEKTQIRPFGIEPVIAFLYVKELEIRACRLVMASKFFGIPKEQTAERLGYLYAD